MTENKKTVERYIDGFRKSDHELILSCESSGARGLLIAVFCDAFTMRNEKIKHLVFVSDGN